MPITELQHKYESLGITIHNAFGVIEAPLITLNRLGKNEPGSVGDLLPDNLEARIRALNDPVSHPERVKRWIAAKRPLAIFAGELTLTLKVRRNEVANTRADLVNCLYNAWDTIPDDCLLKGTDK